MEAEELYDILDNYRGQMALGGDIPLDVICDVIPNEEVARKLIEETSLFTSRSAFPLYKNFIEDFIVKFLGDRKISSVLDPWSNIGTVLKLIKDNFSPESLKGYAINQNLADISNLLFEFPIEMGDVFSLSQNEKAKYDLIISNLPIGLKGREERLGISRNEEAYQIIAQSTQLLETNGIAIFNTTNLLTADRRESQQLLNYLNNEGIAVKALLGLPIKSINTITFVKMQLLVLQKVEQGNVFVGDIKDNEADNEVLLQNYKNNKRGKSPLDGAWLSLQELK